MRLIAVILLSTVASAALSQQAQRTVTLQVTEADLATIARALEAMPYRDAAPVIARLQQQITAQAQKADPPPNQK